jgi:hypothetical protein
MPVDTTACTVASTVVNYPAPTVTDNCPGVGAVTCTPASGTVFPAGTTTVTCTAMDSVGNVGTCTFNVTVGPGFGVCCVDDASGDTFSEVIDPTNPNVGYWQYHVAATGQTFCGIAERVNYVPGLSLTSSDRDDPHYVMQVNVDYAHGTCVARVTERDGNIQHVLRDRNINNNPPCF